MSITYLNWIPKNYLNESRNQKISTYKMHYIFFKKILVLVIEQNKYILIFFFHSGLSNHCIKKAHQKSPVSNILELRLWAFDLLTNNDTIRDSQLCQWLRFNTFSASHFHIIYLDTYKARRQVTVRVKSIL